LPNLVIRQLCFTLPFTCDWLSAGDNLSAYFLQDQDKNIFLNIAFKYVFSVDVAPKVVGCHCDYKPSYFGKKKEDQHFFQMFCVVEFIDEGKGTAVEIVPKSWCVGQKTLLVASITAYRR
ncbi:Uncharacterized protein APZ42_003254, partial [Daphnia magna]